MTWNVTNDIPLHDMVQHPCYIVGVQKQRQVELDWYELLCFWTPTVQLASEHGWFCTMWPGRAKPIGESLLALLFTFFLSSIRLCAEKASGARHEWVRRQTFKELLKLGNWWNFWLFWCNVRGEIGLKKLQNFRVAKALMSSYITVESRFLFL